MLHNDVQAIILAAGRSRRFMGPKSKLISPLCGQEMVLFVTSVLEKLNMESLVVVGHQKELMIDIINKHHKAIFSFIEQETQGGTGHAVVCTKSHWHKDHILVVNGDMPLITTDIIEALYKKHIQSNAALSFVVAHNVDPLTGAFGRIVEKKGAIAIVEAKDFAGRIQDHPYINAGIYLVSRAFLENSISHLKQHGNSQEWYITDLVEIACASREKICTVDVPFDRVRGINTISELAAAQEIVRRDIIEYWMQKGVIFTMPSTVHIDKSVHIGNNCVIHAGVQLLGSTHIGNFACIFPYAVLNNMHVGDCVTVGAHSVLSDSIVEKNKILPAFTHIELPITMHGTQSSAMRHEII